MVTYSFSPNLFYLNIRIFMQKCTLLSYVWIIFILSVCYIPNWINRKWQIPTQLDLQAKITNNSVQKLWQPALRWRSPSLNSFTILFLCGFLPNFYRFLQRRKYTLLIWRNAGGHVSQQYGQYSLCYSTTVDIWKFQSLEFYKQVVLSFDVLFFFPSKKQFSPKLMNFTNNSHIYHHCPKTTNVEEDGQAWS